jgi:hypothetical protein
MYLIQLWTIQVGVTMGTFLNFINFCLHCISEYLLELIKKNTQHLTIVVRQ